MKTLWNVERYFIFFVLDFFSIRFFAAEGYLFLLKQQSRKNMQKRYLLVNIYNFMNYFDMWLTLLNENTEDNDSRYENHVFFTNHNMQVGRRLKLVQLWTYLYYIVPDLGKAVLNYHSQRESIFTCKVVLLSG